MPGYMASPPLPPLPPLVAPSCFTARPRPHVVPPTREAGPLSPRSSRLRPADTATGQPSGPGSLTFTARLLWNTRTAWSITVASAAASTPEPAPRSPSTVAQTGRCARRLPVPWPRLQKEPARSVAMPCRGLARA
ncbi:hypothetical protein CDD83_1389 [Cordyceps sp. RAO-2017]|nr:hypothetical protein CDD83_1389 [Cordyceps sp. RAO-2017]